MNSKLVLFALALLLGTSLVSPAHAEDSVQPISQSAKNTLNLKIDKRLGLLEKPWKVPKFLARTERDPAFPDRFGYRQARFLQPGPPPYFQQPEGANEAGIAALVPSTTVPSTSKATTTSSAAASSSGGGGSSPSGPSGPSGPSAPSP